MATIAVDFDCTCTLHGNFPEWNGDVPGCVNTLKELVKKGNKIVLLTMRDGKNLTDAVEWFGKHKIPLHGINHNPDQTWTKSKKVYYNFLIDDHALGCPLLWDPKKSDRKYVDWNKMRKLLKENNLL